MAKSKTQFHKHFDTWGEFLEFVEGPAVEGQRVFENSQGEERFSYNGGWFKTQNFAEATALAHNGWSDGVEKCKAIAQPLIDRLSIMIERPEIRYDVCPGIDYDMGLVVTGDPEHWMSYEYQTVEGEGNRLVRITFDCTVSSGISAEIIQAKGAVLAALVELLELGGNRVEVVCLPIRTGHGYAYEPKHENYTAYASVVVKRFEQPLDMNRLMFAFAHPSMLRRIGFRFAENCPVAVQNAMGASYGSCIKEQPTEPETRCDIFIGSSIYGDPVWTNTESTQKWLLSNLKKQGIILKEQAKETV